MVTRNPSHYPRVAIVNVFAESTNISPPYVQLSQASPFRFTAPITFSFHMGFFFLGGELAARDRNKTLVNFDLVSIIVI